MGLLDKLFKKGPKADEVSKGGSPIYRYEDKENEGGRRRLMVYTQRR